MNTEEEMIEQQEIIEMWLETLNRPERIEKRNGEEVTKQQVLEMIENERRNAMLEIEKMDPYEFQTRVFNGTLPKFIREKSKKLQRDTNHSRVILTKEQFDKGLTNYGNAHRNKIRYMTTEEFKENCYDLEINNK
jgi:hypothetical protein